MHGKILKYIGLLLAAVSMTAPVAAYAAPRGWEQVRVERTDAKVVVRATEFEISTASGVIVVTANHPVQIKIFTILGRLVNSETLPAGKSQLQLPAHGVYIVKIGDVTCKVAV